MLLFLGNLQTPRFFQLPTDFCFFVLTVKVKKRILFTLIFLRKMETSNELVNVILSPPVLSLLLLLLLLLSRFSRVRLCVTPWTAAHQASPSMGFSRQGYWSGVPLPSLRFSAAAAAAAKSLQSCLILCDPIEGSPPGFCVPGILQARTLEWVAISFSNA